MSRDSRTPRDSGNHDYPPASSRRPAPAARPSEVPLSERYPRTHDLIDTLNAQNHALASGPDWSAVQSLLQDFEVVQQVQHNTEILNRLIETTNSERSDESPRDSQRSTPRPPGDRLSYLRNLLQSGSNRSNADDTSRALETLNREIEQHHLDSVWDNTTYSPPNRVPSPPRLPVNWRSTLSRDIPTAEQTPALHEPFRVPSPPRASARWLRPPVSRNLWDSLHAELGSSPHHNADEQTSDPARERTNSDRARMNEGFQIPHIPPPPRYRPSPRNTSIARLRERRLTRSETSSSLRPARTGNPQEMPSPNTTGDRTLRRRSFRPDLRGTSALNEPIPTPSLMPQPASAAQMSRDGRGRLKRRKLESDDHREGIRGFNYGQYGQVVPGALKMEIASCDGGIYDPEGDSSFPENVLRNDQSVYCTKSDRCNLVLRHRGEAPFCLKKIVIKAPRSGFDSPIQEGMIFVSMTSDELLARTAQYQIQYSNSSAHRRRRNRRLGLQPSQEYLTGFRSPLQSLERTVLMGPDSHSASDNEAAEQNSNGPETEIRVTTDYDDNSEDSIFVEHEQDDVPSVTELERIQVEEDLLCSDSEECMSEDEDNEDSTTTTFSRRRLETQRQPISLRRVSSGIRPTYHQTPSLLNPNAPPSAGTPQNGSTSTSEVLKPHARFFIEREKSMVSIKFDPPPSGRFILVKLWSPRSDGNIDIQSIIAHGYAGPRFFPSGGFR